MPITATEARENSVRSYDWFISDLDNKIMDVSKKAASPFWQNISFDLNGASDEKTKCDVRNYYRAKGYKIARKNNNHKEYLCWGTCEQCSSDSCSEKYRNRREKLIDNFVLWLTK